jgi:hypothetical protein
MQKHWIGVIIGLIILVAIVYLDMITWTTYGPSSAFGEFPLINIVLIPIILIAGSLLWGKWPRGED